MMKTYLRLWFAGFSVCLLAILAANAQADSKRVARTLRSNQSISIFSHRCNLGVRSTSRSRLVVSCSAAIRNRFQKRPVGRSYLAPKQQAIITPRACTLQVRSRNPGNIKIRCNAPTVSSWQIAGTVSGVSGTVVLQNNGTDDLSISSNGNFSFPTRITEGSAYNVTVLTQPATQTCVVTNGVGSVAGASVNNVAITCSTNKHNVTVSAGVNGSVSPTGAQSVNSGGSIALSATPDSGYGVKEWRVDGIVVQSGGTAFQLTNVTSAHTISVTFDTQSISSSVSTLALSVNCLPSSSCLTTQHAALTGTPRQFTITNTGALSLQNVSVSAPTLPSGTSITANTCTGTLSSSATCVVTLTPGDVASSDGSNVPCTSGGSPVANAITVSADGGVSTQVNAYVLGYGCQHQGGFIFSIDDTSPATGSIRGKVASRVDQAAPYIGSGPQATSVIWSSNGNGSVSGDVDYAVILGIDESSTVGAPSPTSPAYPGGTPAYVPCDGVTDGACNSINIISYYNFNRTSGGSAPTPLQYYAAGLCEGTISGYSDWYLPASCEMRPHSGACVAGAQTIDDQLGFLIGDPNSGTPHTSCTPPVGTDCLAGFYWSSTEYGLAPSTNAYVPYFSDGGGFMAHSAKNSQYGVRCTRSF